MQKIVTPFVLMSLLLLQACSTQNAEPDNQPNLTPLTTNQIQVSAASNDFSFTMFKQLRGDEQANMFFSPLSISSALGMTLNGAAGDTRDGILTTIDYSGLQPSDVNAAYLGLSSILTSMDKKVALKFSNSVWYNESFTVNGDFKNAIETSYSGKVQGLNFSNAQARTTINDWVDQNTDHHIKNLIEQLDANTAMVLVNAIYFKGNWATQFDKSKTKSDVFYAPNGPVSTSMMTASDAKVRSLPGDNLTVLEMPYGNGQFWMTVLMPSGSLTLDKLVSDLDRHYLDSIVNKTQEVNAEVIFPKFSLSWKNKLNDPLINMGMAKAFDPDQAEFPNFFTNITSGLSITDVTHQATIDVNEEGSVATAATSVVVGPTSVEPHTVRINHPFVFVLWEKHTQSILFMGQLIDPAATQ